MEKYHWALNPHKLARAIGQAGIKASEEEVRAKYIEIGGKVALSEMNKTNMEEEIKIEDETAPIASEVTATEIVEGIVSDEETISSTQDEVGE